MHRHLALSTTLFAAAAAIAGTAHAHGPHVHGAATLDVALDGERLELQLDAPGASLVGFEHGSRDDAERAALAQAKALLAAPARWIALPAAAGCTLESASAAYGTDTRGDDSHDQPDEHAAFDARSAWRCAEPASLTMLDVTLFAAFPRLERITANLVLPDRQDSRELTPRATRLRLAP